MTAQSIAQDADLELTVDLPVNMMEAASGGKRLQVLERPMRERLVPALWGRLMDRPRVRCRNEKPAQAWFPTLVLGPFGLLILLAALSVGLTACSGPPAEVATSVTTVATTPTGITDPPLINTVIATPAVADVPCGHLFFMVDAETGGAAGYPGVAAVVPPDAVPTELPHGWVSPREEWRPPTV